jgi:hypothetical protein
MTWFVEDPLVVIVLGAATELALVIALFTTQRGKLVWAMLGVAALTGVCLLVEAIVVTPREDVEAVADHVIAALRANDVEAVVGHIDPAATGMIDRARWAMQQIHITSASYFDLKIDVAGTSPLSTATADFVLKVQGDDPLQRSPYSTYIKRFMVTFRHASGRWLMTGYKVGDPLGGELVEEPY